MFQQDNWRLPAKAFFPTDRRRGYRFFAWRKDNLNQGLA